MAGRGRMPYHISMSEEFSHLTSLAAGGSLSESESRRAMELMADGTATSGEIESLLRTPALSLDNVDAPTLTGLVKVVRERAIPVPRIARRPLFDTCGTGGGASTFNISTAAALGLAAAGEVSTDPALKKLGVAKHGNRAIASRSGSADVLENLGVTIEMKPEDAARSIDTLGFGFLFAPAYHRAFSHVQPVRKKLAAEGTRTAFNFVGPLANPAGVSHQVVGIFMPSKLDVVARVLKSLGLESALCVAGADEDGGPVDEISICGPTRAIVLRSGAMTELEFSPGDFGMTPSRINAIRAADCGESARIIRRVLEGGATGQPECDVVVMNMAAALFLATNADLRECARLATEIIASGASALLLDRLVDFSNRRAA